MTQIRKEIQTFALGINTGKLVELECATLLRCIVCSSSAQPLIR